MATPPLWLIEDTPLECEKHELYLCAELSNDSGGLHIERWVQDAQRAFYSLQGAGLHYEGVELVIAVKMYSFSVRSLL